MIRYTISKIEKRKKTTNKQITNKQSNNKKTNKNKKPNKQTN
jgi:hypothetical protein